MDMRKIYEMEEEKNLSRYAVLSKNTKGRIVPMEECPIRTAFQRDRDRIIHAKSFRRLMHKTQVFLAPKGDHYRTRLTHTLEVSQIARTIARGLKLNEDLTESIALGHDLGHTPFGHSGERMLNEICKNGFRHYEQSLRVVDVLEGGKGLNLTFEVRDGIKNHAGDGEAISLEGRIVRLADRIAYINHDIDDAIRGGVIVADDIPKRLKEIIGYKHGERIHNLICDIIANSKDKPYIKMSDTVFGAMDELRDFMFENVYVDTIAQREDEKAKGIICALFEMFEKYPERLPQNSLQMLDSEDKEQVICDYIAGMTDNFAIQTYNEYFVPRSWSIK